MLALPVATTAKWWTTRLSHVPKDARFSPPSGDGGYWRVGTPRSHHCQVVDHAAILRSTGYALQSTIWRWWLPGVVALPRSHHCQVVDHWLADLEDAFDLNGDSGRQRVGAQGAARANACVSTPDVGKQLAATVDHQRLLVELVGRSHQPE